MNDTQTIADAKAGDACAMLKLYQMNRGLIYKSVAKYECRRYPIDDLMQEAYFAMVKAVEAYEPESGYKFTTYLSNTLRWYFFRYVKRDKNRHDVCILDAPLSNEEAERTTKADMIADESAEFEDDVLHRAYMANALRLMREELQGENPLYYDILYRYYAEKQTLNQIAESLGCTFQYVQMLKQKALRLLRYPKSRIIKAYREEIISASYHHSTLTEFKYTHTSSVEWAIEKMYDKGTGENRS